MNEEIKWGGKAMTSETDGIREDSKLLTYGRYRDLGGIINEVDYRSALAVATHGAPANHAQDLAESKAASDAERAGVSLLHIHPDIDARVLYGILRTDVAHDVAHHHSQMSDQRLLYETLLMLEREGAAKAIAKTYTTILS